MRPQRRDARARSLASTSAPGSRRPRIRRKAMGLLVGTALIISGLAAPLSALAADGPYNIDGTIPDAGTTELPDLFGNVKELGPLNSNTTKIGVIHDDAVPTLGLTNPNAQVDLRRAWLDTERDTGTNHDWLYFAWERDSNSGSGFIAYEFMQNPAPAACAYDTATDAQLIANCNPWANRTGRRLHDPVGPAGQQPGPVPAHLDRHRAEPDPERADAAQRRRLRRRPTAADGFRGEAAVDLTATIFGGSTACRTFANTIPSTVTGNSDTADYKDTILKNAPPITNCTSTTVTTPKIVTDTATRHDGQRPGRRSSRSAPASSPSQDSAVVEPHRRHGHAGRLGRLLPVQGRRAGAVHHRWHERSARPTSPARHTRSRCSPRPPTSPPPVATAGEPRSAVTRPTASRARPTSRATECFTVNPVDADLVDDGRRGREPRNAP